MFSDVAELIKVTAKSNALDELVETSTSRQVFVSVRAVNRTEAYEAAAYGLKPSITFILANRADYDDEQRIRYDGKDYRVIRTYFRDDSERLEIICERIINNSASAMMPGA